VNIWPLTWKDSRACRRSAPASESTTTCWFCCILGTSSAFRNTDGAADRRLVKRNAIGGTIPAFQRHNATTLAPVITMQSASAFISLPKECSIDALGYAIEQTV
jgi:hypothetical protein